MSGHVVIPLPDVAAEANWVAHLGSLSKETGEIVGRICEALADDGDISKKESVDLELRREVAEAMEALARIDKALERVEWGDA